MTLADYVRDIGRAVRDEGVGAAVGTALHDGRVGLFRRLDRLGYNRGPSMLERDWDVLVVLDACRHDHAAVEFPAAAGVPDDVGSVLSPASMSASWMRRTFGEASATAVGRVTYVTANPFSESSLEPNRFQAVHEVWRTAWDDELGTCPPGPVTDAAIAAGRQPETDRLVVHYMQPHYPMLDSEHRYGDSIKPDAIGTGDSDSPLDRVADGEVEPEAVHEAYRQNLRDVLEEVASLLENIDAETVAITADHGNAIGEHGVYGHPREIPLKPIRRVPWVTTSAVDGHTRDGALPADGDEGGDEIQERLEQLGYL